tara:strand:+ start:1143 stop:2294 length:1152 start_codon:yes stop_codon:yes gene_type:complete
MKKKIAIYCGNVSTYHTPIFKKLSQNQNLDINVMFGSDEAFRPFFNKEFNHILHFDKKIVEGFKHTFFYNFLENDSRRGFFCRINPGMFFHILFTKYDYVIIFGYDTLSSWLVFIASLLTRKKIIWRGEAIDRKNRPLTKLLKKIVLPLYFYPVYKICFSCEKNYKYLSNYSFDKKKFIFFPSAVDNQYYQNQFLKNINKKIQILKDLRINENKFIMLVVGRLTKRKNVVQIIETLKLLKNNNIQILIIGDGPEKNNIKNSIYKNNIDGKLLGYLKQEEISRVFTICDFLCIFSNYDASPKVINEVMNFGKPIIARNTIGTAGDLVIHNYNGYIVNNSQDLLNSLNIIQNKELLKELGNNSLELINNKFNIETIEENISKVCK